MPDDSEFRPGAHDLETPFLFVPHGAPDPVEFKRQHPSWVSFPATFVPHPQPIPKWKIINGQRWPLDKKGRPWPKTRYGRPTCRFDELPPSIRAPGMQVELMCRLDNPMLQFGGEPMPTVAEFSALAARLRAEQAASAPPPPVQRAKAYDDEGMAPARDYLDAIERVSDTSRQVAGDAAFWSAVPTERIQMSDNVLNRNGAAPLAATRKIGSSPSGASGAVALSEAETPPVAQPSGVVLSDADPDPVLESRQYAAAPLALAVVPALRFGARVMLNEAAKPSGENEKQLPAVDETEAVPKTVTVSPDRRTHILSGNKTGGGHRPGVGIPGKTEFPTGWSG